MEHPIPPADHAESDAQYDAWFRREVQIGLDQANAGLLISDEQVKAEASIWRAQMRQKIADVAL